MLTYAVILFALGAAGGLYVASRHLKGNPPSIGLALLHGVLGAAGLVCLVLFVLKAGNNLATLALVLFVLAALGGFVLFAKHLKGRPLGKGLITGHALVAVIGFVLLLAVLLG